MPSWMPGEDYLINFRKGDPYIKVDEEYARLPGAGYEAIHPELEGLDPEDYPDIAKLRILGDVAPYSREYQKISARVRIDAKDNPDIEAEYGRIAEQVRQTKESTLQVAQRHFNAPVDTVEGTVKSVKGLSVELKEYPGRTFRFSSVGGSMADMTVDITRSLPARHTYFSPRGRGTSPRLVSLSPCPHSQPAGQRFIASSLDPRSAGSPAMLLRQREQGRSSIVRQPARCAAGLFTCLHV